MKKWMVIFIVIVLLFMIISLSSNYQLKNKLGQLENEIKLTKDQVNDTKDQVYDLKYEILETMEKENSLLSSYDIEISYENGEIQASIKVVPKEKRTDEKIFITLAREKKEAILVNDSQYKTKFVFPLKLKTAAIVSFESESSIRQELLPLENIERLLSIHYLSNWETRNDEPVTDSGIFSMHIDGEENIINGINSATLIIKDFHTGGEIGREQVVFEKDKEIGGLSFEVVLEEYLENIGSYIVAIEIKTEEGISYKGEIAHFETAKEGGATRSSGTGSMIPNWYK